MDPVQIILFLIAAAVVFGGDRAQYRICHPAKLCERGSSRLARPRWKKRAPKPTPQAKDAISEGQGRSPSRSATKPRPKSRKSASICSARMSACATAGRVLTGARRCSNSVRKKFDKKEKDLDRIRETLESAQSKQLAELQAHLGPEHRGRQGAVVAASRKGHAPGCGPPDSRDRANRTRGRRAPGTRDHHDGHRAGRLRPGRRDDGRPSFRYRTTR